MQVQDLIHLLQTRCKPEDDILFTAFVPNKDGSVTQNFGDPDNCFDGVIWQEKIEASGPSQCLINIGRMFLNNLFVDLQDIDLEKITNGTLDIKGNRKKTLNQELGFLDQA